MALTLQDALKIQPFNDAQIIVGTDWEDRPISSVNIIEVPTVSRWMRGGELLFTSGFAFQGDIPGACRILKDLASKKIAALVLKTGEYMEEIPVEIIQCCESIGLPLLQIPEDMPYFSVMHPLLERLIDEQVWMLRHIEDVHNTLIQTMLTDGSLFSLSFQLKSLIGGPILLMDTRQKLLASSEIDPSDARELLHAFQTAVKKAALFLPKLSSFRCHRFDPIDGLEQFVTVPIDVNRSRHAYLIMSTDRINGIANYDAITLEHAGMLYSLIFQQQQALFDKEWQLKGECLDDLIWGNYSDEDHIMSRADYLGIDLTKPYFIASINNENSLTRPDPPHNSSHSVEPLHEPILRRLAQARLPSLMYNKGTSIVFLSVLEETIPSEIPSQILEEIIDMLRKKKPNSQISMGVSSIKSSVTEAKAAYKESVTALKCGITLFPEQNVYSYDQLGVYRFLSQMGNTELTRSYFQQYLSPLIRYDQEKNGDLVKTLKCYFECNGSLSKMSEVLFLHKNSITYRLKKIESLTDCKIRDYESAFQLQLCLKLEPIINSISSI